MSGATQPSTTPLDSSPVLRGLLDEIRRLADRGAEVVQVRRQAIPGGGANAEAAGAEPVKRPRSPGGNFAKVRRYLESLDGLPATIPTISRNTGVPQSSVRTLVYETRRDN